MDLRTTVRDIAGHRVLTVEGVADLAATPALHDALSRLVEPTDENLTSFAVDVDAVTVLDDAALGLLLGAAATARANGRTLRVVCSADRLRRRLSDTRFDRAVDVTGSLSGPVAGDVGEVS
jgi:anti-anti-sigma factor